ncbi:enoyl-CoA hydratase/isomerase family protein [Hydrogenophaga sp.]|uniref:enoyl-CoA hydratase/isomerase family protein n=1 Tax=Hydrogenophaga sp. TaxID=1904254 RepID=UPI00271C3E1A|nr:enoyl-CoA hydratase-related protein [Hydrogenophaga sp.]MDO9434182.1 enoyl-CoA hydratase-related protein [Hydrogenophaga sp.]
MPVTLHVRDFVATITLDRPEAMNAIDPESSAQLVEAWAEVSSRDDIRVAVVTGAGDRAFCTGADLKKTMPPSTSFAQLHFGSSKPPSVATLQTDKPLIAAINGYCLGGGLELALMCDVRIASSAATFGLPEVTIGSIPGGGGTQRLVRSVARSDAMLMLLSGERMDAHEALRIGLVSRVVPADALMAEAQKIAQRIASNAPLAVVAVKRLAMQGGELSLAAGLELEQQAFGVLRDSEDRLEGRRAFAEKRPSQFKGR